MRRPTTSHRFSRRAKRRTMTELESAQCDLALARVSHYVRWRITHPGVPYARWPLGEDSTVKVD